MVALQALKQRWSFSNDHDLVFSRTASGVHAHGYLSFRGPSARGVKRSYFVSGGSDGPRRLSVIRFLPPFIL